jgi:hypothetical protein
MRGYGLDGIDDFRPLRVRSTSLLRTTMDRSGRKIRGDRDVLSVHLLLPINDTDAPTTFGVA